MTKLSISLLGGFSVTLDGKPITSFESNKVRALLAYLATETDRPHSRDKLAALLWPDMPDQAARNNLRYALSNLRKAIGDAYTSQPFVCISKQTVNLNLEANLAADVVTFSRQLAQSPLSLSNLEEALRVYQGDFLEGFYVGGDSAFEEWAVLKREQLRRQALDALHRLAQAYEKNGQMDKALAASWRLVDLEPWSEESHRDLMFLLGRSGRRAAALSQYETCCRMLKEQLNVEPSSETTRLYEQIRDGEIKALSEPRETASLTAEERAGATVESASDMPEAKRSEHEPAKSRWLKIAGAGLLVILLATAGIYTFLNRWRPANPIVSPASGEIVGPCADPGRPLLCITNARTGLVTQVVKDLPFENLEAGFSWSPDGSRIVFSARAAPLQGKDHHANLYVIHRDGTDLRQITSEDFDDILPAWSPDGEWIAFHRNCALWTMRPDGSEASPLSSGLCATEITWSPDSRWIAFLEMGMRDGSRHPTIRVYERAGSDSRIIYTFPHSLIGGRVAWSPDGQKIVVVYNTGSGPDETILLDAQGQGVLEEDIEIPISWFENFYPQWGD